MKKALRGFTLVECLVALAILGIASLTMAQIYAGVSKRNRENHLINSSLSNQMAYVEKYTNSEAVPIYFGGGATSSPDPHATSDHKPPTSGNFVQITKVTDAAGTLSTTEKYSYPADLYVLYSRDADDKDSSDSGYKGETEDKYNLRYKYIVGHQN